MKPPNPNHKHNRKSNGNINGNIEKMEKKKYVVEFTRKLTARFDEAKKDNQEVENPNHFQVQQSFFNFDGDCIQFMLKTHYALKPLIKKKVILYTTMGKQSLTLPLSMDDTSRAENNTIYNIQGCFKNRLLNLFSFNNRAFKLTIDYELDGENYCISFVTPLPQINNQDDWNPKHKFTKVFMPIDLPHGRDLNRLFKNEFHIKRGATNSEVDLHKTLMSYAYSDLTEKMSEDYNFMEMLIDMLVIEDLDNFKQTEDYCLRLQKVASYECCRYAVRSVIDDHLNFLMCDTKHRRFIRDLYVIETNHKMPVDSAEFEYVYITDMIDYQNYHDDLAELKERRIIARIAYIFDNLILVKIAPTRSRTQRVDAPKLNPDRPYHVDFIPNRISTRVAFRALEDLQSSNMTKYLRNFEMESAESREGEIEEFEWMNESIEDNEEQQTAIRNIVNCTAYPSPYIIFGGPGTGKSSTLVEAIAQVVKLKKKSHILVAASSNSACDDIGNRLLKYVSLNKILRIYSPSFDHKPDKLDAVLQKISNFRNRTICSCKKRSCIEMDPLDDPTYDEFYTARVVIVTLVSCGRIVSSGINSNHFDYIFIDEAAAECEQRTLIPIAGLGLSMNKVNAQIVLSGDHKQLGAVIGSSFARKLGMEMSLMERLMLTDEKYECVDGEYDENYVTQLKKNYRNHPIIMRFSNENFYNSNLVSCCSEEILNFAKDPELLIYNPEFPIIFHTTLAPSKEVGTSLKNDTECAVIGYYLNVLLRLGINGNNVSQKDIGIICPYRGQRDLIIEKHQRAHPEVEIGTVDAFQGREKKIIIMSLVRSQTRHVGFLRNEKRLNVSLTRAKALLIIIGNAATLQRCSIWNKFITYCFENKAVVGDIHSVNHAAATDETKAENEELPENGVEEEYAE